MKKEYTNGEVTIVWQPGICIHSEKCWRGLANVFQPKSKPWINAEGASSEEIEAQVKQCPSGALATYRNADGKPSEESLGATTIELIPNGPAIVKGDCVVKLNNGTTKTMKDNTALCRCGASSNKPFCDGSHSKAGFEAE